MSDEFSNEPPYSAGTSNFAAAGSHVGIQADEIHDSDIYVYYEDSPPSVKYNVGVRYLNHGVPFKAEEAIAGAVADGLNNPEVRFHWILAILSKRSYRDLSNGERDRLDILCNDAAADPQDVYQQALEAVGDLLSHLANAEGIADETEKKILILPPDIRAKIDRDLGLILSGGIRDKLWKETRDRSRVERFGNDRLARIWAYFHPDPIPPRQQVPRPPSFHSADRFRLFTTATLSVLSLGYLGWSVAIAGNITAIAAYLAAVVFSAVGCRSLADWHFRAHRLKTEAERYRPIADDSGPRGSGFASAVHRNFTFYFSKYRPNGVEVENWLMATSGIRNSLRSEITLMYREQRVLAERVNWLIAFLARDVRKQWRQGRLPRYRVRYRLPVAMVARTILCGAMVLASVVPIVTTALPESPFIGSIALIAAIVAVPMAVRLWLHQNTELRRVRDESADMEEEFHARVVEFKRWKAKLVATRPTEGEMETWLYCDKTALLDNALEHYHLSWHDVLAYAVIQAPARSRQRRKVPGGQWRYSRYDLRLFLITRDGVREISSTLNFRTGEFSGQTRNNYRFDAVASAKVTESSSAAFTLKLILSNGPEIDISVRDPEVSSDTTESPDEAPTINLDVSGFNHALHLLEGIAAEGKHWVEREFGIDPERCPMSTNRLPQSTSQPMSLVMPLKTASNPNGITATH